MKSFVTLNNVYTIHKDLGDGAFLISGNEHYCSTPSVALFVEPPVVGKRAVFRILSGSYVEIHPYRLGNRISTSPVVSIQE